MKPFNAEGVFETQAGEKLTLVCDFYAIDIAQQVAELSWDDIVERFLTDRVLAVKVLYALLRRKHAGVTIDEAADVSFDKNQIALWAIMGDVVRRACNIDQEAKDENPPKRRGRSRSSAKSG